MRQKAIRFGGQEQEGKKLELQTFCVVQEVKMEHANLFFLTML